jgi:hypothetical protein
MAVEGTAAAPSPTDVARRRLFRLTLGATGDRVSRRPPLRAIESAGVANQSLR